MSGCGCESVFYMGGRWGRFQWCECCAGDGVALRERGGSIDLQYVLAGLGDCSVDVGCVSEFWVGGY